MVETRNGRRFAVFFFVAAFLVLFLGRWIAPVDRVALSAAAPFQSATSAIANAIGDELSGIFQGPRMQSENQALKHEIGLLIRQNLTLQQRIRDDAQLRRILRFERTGTNGHLALLVSRVIGEDSNSAAPAVLINKGTKDGMRPGLTVLDQNGNFVGTIASVSAISSWVQLMLSPSSSVGAVDMETGAKGLVEGRFAAGPVFDNVVISAVVRPGDFIVTSGDYNLYPRTLLLGQVVSVNHKNFDLFQTANIAPATDFGHLEIVSVVRNWIPSVSSTLVKGQ